MAPKLLEYRLSSHSLLYLERGGYLKKYCCQNRLTLIGGPAGWRAVFPNEKREFLAGCTEDERGAAQKGGPAGCEKGQAGGLQKGSPALSLIVNAQPAGPPSCAARGNFMFFIWKHGPPAGPPALCLVLSPKSKVLAPPHFLATSPILDWLRHCSRLGRNVPKVQLAVTLMLTLTFGNF